MTIAAFQERVEWVIGELERMNDRQHPLRAFPMDLVADAVARECGVDDLATIPPRTVAESLNVILKRNRGAAIGFNVTSSTFDSAGPWLMSSYLPHEGIDRLSDGGTAGPSE